MYPKAESKINWAFRPKEAHSEKTVLAENFRPFFPNQGAYIYHCVKKISIGMTVLLKNSKYFYDNGLYTVDLPTFRGCVESVVAPP